MKKIIYVTTTKSVQIEMPDSVFETIHLLIPTFKVNILDTIDSNSEVSMVYIDEATNIKRN